MTVHSTVVFTDLDASTAIFETMGNARATQAVTALTRWISELTVNQGGRVIKTLGDGVMAVFSDPAQALQFALELQRRHRKNMARLPSAERMLVRVGVAQGAVEFVDGDCYGDAVNVAARLNKLCGPEEIWVHGVDPQVLPQSPDLRFRELGPITVRGRIQPCEVFELAWGEEETSDFLTMQGSLETLLLQQHVDVLGRSVTLTWLEQSRVLRSFDLPIRIGRAQPCEFIVNDMRVSRTHARMEWRNGSIVLVDVSSYGCWLRFEGSGADVQLRRQDCVLHGRGSLALGAPFADPQVPVVTFSVL